MHSLNRLGRISRIEKAFVVSLWDLSSIIVSVGVRADPMDAAARRELIVRLRERLGVDVSCPTAWDRPDACGVGRQRSDGWALLPTCAGNAPCVMFLDGAQQMWRFGSGDD